MRVLHAVLLLALAAPVWAQRAPDKRLSADTPQGVEAQKRLREGERRLREDEFAEAAKAFQEAIALDPDLAMAHHGLGTARMALKEYPAAIAAFEAARAAFERSAAEIDRRLVKVEAALAERLAALEAQGPSTRAPEALNALRREQAEKLERFREERKRARQLPSGLTLALGSAYFRTGQLADAEREYRATLLTTPALGEARVNLAVVLLMTGRAVDAKEQLEIAKRGGYKVPPGLQKDVDAALAKAK